MAGTNLYRTPTARTNNKKFTYSCWFKRSNIGTGQYLVINYESGNDRGYISFQSDDKMFFYDKAGGTERFEATSNFKLRDTNAWYHLLYSVDTTASSNRTKIYINGVDRYSDFTVPIARALDSTVGFQQGTTSNGFRVGSQESGSTTFDGLMSHVNFVDGLQLDATAFGEIDSTTGEWKIKTSPTVSEYGNNGFFILKDGNSVTDQSGKGNNFGIGGSVGSLTKTEDNPSNVFATWNILAKHSDVNLHNGNTRAVFANYGVWKFVYSTLGASSGKYYYEVKVANGGSDSSIGIMEMDTATNEQATADNVGKNTESVGYQKDGTIKKNNSNVQTGLGSISNGEILGIAMDLDNNTVQFYLQGVARGTAVSIASNKTYAFATSGYTSAEHQTNFGNGYFETTAVASAGTNASGIGIFEYNVPTGFTALSTKGLNL